MPEREAISLSEGFWGKRGKLKKGAEQMVDANTLELVDIELLLPCESNARTHSVEQIRQIQASIRAFGFINPIIIDRHYNIIAGHGRFYAAQLENMDKIPCVFAEGLSDTQKKAYIIADNQIALNSEWDKIILGMRIDELRELDFDISLLGLNFDVLEIAEAIDLEKSGENEVETKETFHCPKCGFEFEV